MGWTVEDQVGDLPKAIAYFHSKLPGWWFSVGACHVSADASVCPDTAGIDAWLFKTGDREAESFFDEGFHADLHPPATMAGALIRATDLAFAARDAYCVRRSVADARIAYSRLNGGGWHLESSSEVERLAVNEDVAGSNPASPAKFDFTQG